MKNSDKNIQEADAAGTVFDEKLHQKRFGKPLRRKTDGLFVLKKGVKPPATVAKTAPKPPETPPAVSHETEQSTAQWPQLPLHDSPPATVTDGATVFTGFDNDSFPEVTAKPASAGDVPPTPDTPPETPPKETPFSHIGDEPPPPETEDSKNPGEDAGDGNALTSAIIVGVLEGINVATFGDGMTMLPAEKKNITEALDKTLGRFNVQVPPWMELAGAVGVYYFLRIGYISEARKKKEEERRVANAKPVNESKPAETVA